MNKKNVGLLWLFALFIGATYHTPIASAVSVAYRNAVIYGSGASSCDGALGASCSGKNLTYWKSDGHLYAHHADNTETIADSPAIGTGGGTVTGVLTSGGISGGPVTSTGTISLDSAWFPVNVRGYGATGNGTTDDTAAIQAAINAAPAGSTLRIPDGTYKLSGSGSELLLINKPINIECAGWNTILSVSSSVPNTTDVIHITSSTGGNNGMTIRNCSILSVNGSSKAITAATNATPISITSTAHGFSTGNTIKVSGVLGNTNANGTWVITVVDANTFTLNGSKGNAAYTSGGTAAFVPGRHGINLDVTSGNVIQNIQFLHNTIGPFGGRALVTTNTAPVQNGVFLLRAEDNILRNGVNLSNAGDSLLFKGNTVTGGFNAFDVALVQGPGNPVGGGAHLLVIEDNNVTSQGCFVRVTAGSTIRIINNNVEPGATGSAGIDTSNCANGAAIDFDGTSAAPIYTGIIRGNYLANWTNNSTSGNIVRVNWAVGTVIEQNDAERAAAGPFSYVITSNAVNTNISIPSTEDSSITGTTVSDAGTRTWLHFFNPDGSEEFGSTTSVSYRMRIRGGTTQSGDIFDVQKTGGTHLIEIPSTGDVLLGGVADAGFPVQLGSTLMGGRIEIKAGLVAGRTTVADAAYTALQTDWIIAYTSLTAGRIVTLPTSVRAGTIFVIKNETSGAFAITATPTSGTCDGAASCATAASARASLRLYFDGTNYETF
jgi:hypothetical protein